MSRYIDADELALWIKEAWHWDTVDGIKGTAILRQIIADIENAPTADVKPIEQGKWVRARCSQCGHLDVEEPDYCSRCGAEMENRQL